VPAPIGSWSVEAVAAVLAKHGIDAAPILLQGVPQSDPRWAVGHARIGDRLVAKFALSDHTATRIARETRILRRLHGRLPIPEVVVASDDPVFLGTRKVAGEPLHDGTHAATDLARFLGALHDPAILELAGDEGPAAEPQATTAALRARLPPLVRADQRALIARWCDWVDRTLASPREPVFVHGDLHGHNQIWRSGRLRLVADFDAAGQAEPEYDLRYLLGLGGPTLLREVIARYPRPLSVDRALAWSVRTLLGDALWRTEKGVPLPGGGTAASWADAMARHFETLSDDRRSAAL